MFIQVETTPNPSALKFLPGRQVLPAGVLEFKNMDEAGNAPLAQTIFRLPGVASVFLGTDFITVSKADTQDWQVLKPYVLGAVMDHFMSGLPVVTDTTAAPQPRVLNASDELSQQIIEILETRVRPAVAQDGGDISFHDFKDGVVYVELKGACSGCPSSTATLKNGIENMLKFYVPEVVEVRSV